MPGDKDKQPLSKEQQLDDLAKKLAGTKSKAAPEVRAKLEKLMQQLALQESSSGKEKKTMEEHKFWNTQPVPKHGKCRCLKRVNDSY